MNCAKCGKPIRKTWWIPPLLGECFCEPVLQIGSVKKPVSFKWSGNATLRAKRAVEKWYENRLANPPQPYKEPEYEDPNEYGMPGWPGGI